MRCYAVEHKLMNKLALQAILAYYGCTAADAARPKV